MPRSSSKRSTRAAARAPSRTDGAPAAKSAGKTAGKEVRPRTKMRGTVAPPRQQGHERYLNWASFVVGQSGFAYGSYFAADGEPSSWPRQ